MLPHEDRILIELIMAAHLDPDLPLDALKDYIQERGYTHYQLMNVNQLQDALREAGYSHIGIRKNKIRLYSHMRLQMKIAFGPNAFDNHAPAIPFEVPL